MAYLGDPTPVAERDTRTTVFRIGVFVVIFAAICGATGWYYYGNLIVPPPTVIADPTQKIGPADGMSKNAATIDKLDKPAAPANH